MGIKLTTFKQYSTRQPVYMSTSKQWPMGEPKSLHQLAHTILTEMKTVKIKIIIVRLYPGLINKQGIVRMNKTNIIMSLTRVMVDSFAITLWQTMSLINLWDFLLLGNYQRVSYRLVNQLRVSALSNQSLVILNLDNMSWLRLLFPSNKFNCSGIQSILKPKILSFLTVVKEWKRHRHVLLSTWCHAHCLFDSVFAVLKKLYRRSYVDSLDQLEMVVNCLSTTNTTVRYPRWEWRDWQTFLAQVFQNLRQNSKKVVIIKIQLSIKLTLAQLNLCLIIVWFHVLSFILNLQ